VKKPLTGYHLFYRETAERLRNDPGQAKRDLGAMAGEGRVQGEVCQGESVFGKGSFFFEGLRLVSPAPLPPRAGQQQLVGCRGAWDLLARALCRQFGEECSQNGQEFLRCSGQQGDSFADTNNMLIEGQVWRPGL
jgi:hypothetical protein